jgi:hypothetical protein
MHRCQTAYEDRGLNCKKRNLQCILMSAKTECIIVERENKQKNEELTRRSCVAEWVNFIWKIMRQQDYKKVNRGLSLLFCIWLISQVHSKNNNILLKIKEEELLLKIKRYFSQNKTTAWMWLIVIIDNWVQYTLQPTSFMVYTFGFF